MRNSMQILSSVLSLGLMIPLHLKAAEAPLRNFRFAEAISLQEKEGLPPKLEMKIEIMCNEEFLKVIRHERQDPKSKQTTIAVGALVAENPLSSCAGVKRTITVPAGTTFSGRQYETSRIRKD